MFCIAKVKYSHLRIFEDDWKLKEWKNINFMFKIENESLRFGEGSFFSASVIPITFMTGELIMAQDRMSNMAIDGSRFTYSQATFKSTNLITGICNKF